MKTKQLYDRELFISTLVYAGLDYIEILKATNRYTKKELNTIYEVLNDFIPILTLHYEKFYPNKESSE